MRRMLGVIFTMILNVSNLKILSRVFIVKNCMWQHFGNRKSVIKIIDVIEVNLGVNPYKT